MDCVNNCQALFRRLFSIIISATFSRAAVMCLHLRRARGTWLSLPLSRKTYSSHVQLPAYRSTVCARFLRDWLVTCHCIAGKDEFIGLSVYCGVVLTDATEEGFARFLVIKPVEEAGSIVVSCDDCGPEIAGSFVDDGEQVGLHTGGQAFLP